MSTSTSTAVPNPQNYTDDKKVVIDIYKMLENISINEQICHRVCACQVPKSISSAKPEAFIPQFVGLGPYHHSRSDISLTDELKLCVAKRFLGSKGLLPQNSDLFYQRLQNFVSHVQAYYHIDVLLRYNYPTLLFVLTVDGLFLLGLLHGGVTTNLEGEGHTYILTGKLGIPLVNSAGVELTINGIMRDVFMLENQIPTHFLKQITRVNFSNTEEIQSLHNDLGSTMQNFCEAVCPLIHVKQLNNKPEDHDHLLDLMYQMIVTPKSNPESEPQPEPGQPQPQIHRFDILKRIIVGVFIGILVTDLLFVYYCKVIGKVIFWLLRWVLHKFIPFVPGPTSGPTVNMPSRNNIVSTAIDIAHGYFFRNGSLTPIVGQIRDSYRERDSTNSSDEGGMLPSATELHDTKIKFQPAEGGISSIEFDEKNRQFYLPCIRLDAVSEVIMRNLVAYESLIKPNCLVFTAYVELLSALILTVADVKLLVRQKIIQTQLKDEVVVQLFNGMMTSKSITNIWATRIQKFEQEIKKVKTQFDGFKNEQKILSEFVFPALLVILFIPVSLMIMSSATSMICLVNRSSKLCTPPEVGVYDGDNYFLSSM